MPKKSGEREGAKYVRYFGPVLDALRQLGGSGTPSEVTNKVAENLNIPETQQTELLKSGSPRFANQIAWARNYLKLEGYIDSSKKGVWVLTNAGYRSRLTQEDARKLFLKWVAFHQGQKQKKVNSLPIESATPDDSSADTYQGHREELLALLKKLPPSGFETLCQRLLRDHGFDSVVVTGRSGDGGIDGHGILKLNPFVTFKVLFQCKRYDKQVNPSHIREFQGVISGRADKGIIITTGTFSNQARSEAVRDGAPPIELIDGQNLIEMFEELELGLKPKTVFEIDRDFFDQFGSKEMNRHSATEDPSPYKNKKRSLSKPA